MFNYMSNSISNSISISIPNPKSTQISNIIYYTTIILIRNLCDFNTSYL